MITLGWQQGSNGRAEFKTQYYQKLESLYSTPSTVNKTKQNTKKPLWKKSILSGVTTVFLYTINSISLNITSHIMK
jgi:hypothetical protein